MMMSTFSTGRLMSSMRPLIRVILSSNWLDLWRNMQESLNIQQTSGSRELEPIMVTLVTWYSWYVEPVSKHNRQRATFTWFNWNNFLISGPIVLSLWLCSALYLRLKNETITEAQKSSSHVEVSNFSGEINMFTVWNQTMVSVRLIFFI